MNVKTVEPFLLLRQSKKMAAEFFNVQGDSQKQSEILYFFLIIKLMPIALFV